MTLQLHDNAFKIGLNMAGAISAGAYTAGVVDFLFEALEEWQKRKDDDQASRHAPVPLHDVRIDVLSGASAGGMCAAIAAVLAPHQFAHIRNGEERDTTNTFYESWVNRIDIAKLLTTRDVERGPLVSLLDPTVIDEIADYALRPRPSEPLPQYISNNLTLFLTLSNVRGVPYRLYSDAATAVEEFVAYYADRLQFELVAEPGDPCSSQAANALPRADGDTGAWNLLKDAAKATGAFPLFLAPRIIERNVADYANPGWQPLCSTSPADPIPPAFDPPPGPTWQTLNVDGGVTNNNPFRLAHDFLASGNPNAMDCHNPKEPDDANCAVITVAPFPAQEAYDPDFDCLKAAGIWPMLARLVSVLLSQSRFLGESVEVLATGRSFSRFVIAPSDPHQPRARALQCSTLGAFGGFFERGFRVHDFLLGRRNCQRFLGKYFCLPTRNPVIASGLAKVGAGEAAAIAARWCVDPPNALVEPQGRVWMPIIPLCGTCKEKISLPERRKMSRQSLDRVVDLVATRVKAIAPPLLHDAPAGEIMQWGLRLLLTWPISAWAKGALRGLLADSLRPDLDA